MKKRLQNFSFRKTRYDLVTQKWLCGRLKEDMPCAQGPDKRGNCPGAYECIPIKKGDRWYCTRPKKFGGACAEGPDPNGVCGRPPQYCQPQLNSRYQRGRIVRWFISLCVAVLLVFSAGKLFSGFINPGSLSSGHSHTQDCTQCHTEFAKGFSRMFHKEISQSKCLSCHALGKNPALAHSLAPGVLATLTKQKEAIKPSTLLAKTMTSLARLPIAEQQFNCAHCHKEHRGSDVSLTAVPNQICQACHQSQFSSFDEGHPEFTQLPALEKLSRVKYDHYKHDAKHFSESAFKDHAPKDCSSCHHMDPRHDYMELYSYQESCSSCHDGQILGRNRAGDKGLAFINVPLVDFETLQEKGFGIGEWPEIADEDMTLFMQFLLMASEDVRADYAKLNDLTLDDLQDANAEQLQAAANIIWAYKLFLFDLSDKGSRHKMFVTIPEDTIRAVTTAWFPNLAQEIEAHRAGRLVKTVLLEDESKMMQERAEQFEKTGEAWAHSGGWYWDGYTLYYRPRAHADAFIRTWLEHSAQTASQSSDQTALNIFTQLSQPNSPGACMKCHRVKEKDGEHTVEWWALQRTGVKGRFTRFSHKPHINLKQCQDCHTSNPHSKGSDDFLAISKATCVTCHNTKKVFDNCVGCHDYHIG